MAFDEPRRRRSFMLRRPASYLSYPCGLGFRIVANMEKLTMAIDRMNFEGFFNAIHASLAKDGFANPGRTAMHAGAFDFDEIGILSLRAFQFGVAYLVNEGELPGSYNDRASALVSGADAYALLEDIHRDAGIRILTNV